MRVVGVSHFGTSSDTLGPKVVLDSSHLHTANAIFELAAEIWGPIIIHELQGR